MNAKASDPSIALSDEAWLCAHYEESCALLQSIGRLFLGPDPGRQDVIDDEIQEVFVQLWRKRDKLRAHPNTPGWIVDAFRRQLLRHVSRAARRSRCFSAVYYEDAADLHQLEQTIYPQPSDALEGQDRYAQLIRVLGQENAAIFYCYCVLNYSARELAKSYGVSEACIWTRISRAKQRILKSSALFFTLVFALACQG